MAGFLKETVNLDLDCGSPVASSCSIVLLGKVGAGKSATGNTITERKKYFLSKRRSKAVTTKICKGTVCTDGRELVVYDTPGFCDPDRSDEEISEIIKTVLWETSSKPRVFLLVVKIDGFTAEEKSVVCKLENLLGEMLLKNTLILFTRGDELEDQSIEDFIEDDNNLKIMMEKYGTRYHVFNNKIEDPEQVKLLVEKIERFCQTPKPSRGPSIRPQNPPKRRMILLGKTGVGKSATGNTILGVDYFKSEQSMVSVTQRTQVGHGVVSDRDVCVVDTPGLFDSKQDVDQLSKEFVASIMSCEPGPHAFLIIMPMNNRFTKHEKEAIEILDKLFGSGLEKHAILIFTHGDLLDEGNTIEKMIAQSPDLSKIVKQCGGRYQLINNKCRHNRDQVNELLGKIDKMLEMNGGSHYTNEMFTEAARVAAEAAEEEEKRKQWEKDMLKMKAEEGLRSLKEQHRNDLAVIETETKKRVQEEDEKLQKVKRDLENLILRQSLEAEYRKDPAKVIRKNEPRLIDQERTNQNQPESKQDSKLSSFRKRLMANIRRVLIGAGIGIVVGAVAGGKVGGVVGIGIGAVLGGVVCGIIGGCTGKDPKKDN